MQINAQYGQREYQRRNPQTTALYKVIQDNFLQVKENLSAHGKELAPYVEEEFNKFLKCGVLSEGFARVKCTAPAQECGKEYLACPRSVARGCLLVASAAGFACLVLHESKQPRPGILLIMLFLVFLSGSGLFHSPLILGLFWHLTPKL